MLCHTANDIQRATRESAYLRVYTFKRFEMKREILEKLLDLPLVPYLLKLHVRKSTELSYWTVIFPFEVFWKGVIGTYNGMCTIKHLGVGL